MKISNDVLKLIQNEISDDTFSKLFDINDPDKLFDFYQKILKTIMSSVYEKYGDTFNTKACAAPDEY